MVGEQPLVQGVAAARVQESQEEQPHVQGAATARVQEGSEQLLHVQGQEGQPCGDIPHSR